MVRFDIDELSAKAGGRFRLVALVQKRMRELLRGLPPLVEHKGTLFETALEEVRAGAIWLAMGEEAEKLRAVRAAELQAPPRAALPLSPAPQLPARKPVE